jgi:hypothetical protein
MLGPQKNVAGFAAMTDQVVISRTPDAFCRGAGSDVTDGQQTPNAGRRTLNIELRKGTLCIRRWTLGVECWAFSENSYTVISPRGGTCLWDMLILLRQGFGATRVRKIVFYEQAHPVG